MSEVAIAPDRRNRKDRRRRPTPMFSRYTLSGRRVGGRRGEETANIYVDRYSNRMMAVLIAIVGLCVLDALFTLLYLQQGGEELNPVMRAMIDRGVVPFVIVKCGLTLLGMLFLALHKNFRFVKGILASVLTLYVGLLCYHLYLAATV